MQIAVRAEGGAVEESYLLEMQGELESRSQAALESKLIGDLHYTKDGTPIMIIGHHILYGKIVVLDKPFISMEKVVVEKEKVGRAEEDMEEGEPQQQTEYRVRTVIRRKIVFKTRPKPIIVVPKQNED